MNNFVNFGFLLAFSLLLSACTSLTDSTGSQTGYFPGQQNDNVY